jgi:hypothetical protein
MCTRVNRIVVGVALLIAMSTLISSSVLADNDTYADKRESRQDVNRWVPAFAFVGAFHGQGQKSSLSSSCDFGGRAPKDDIALIACSQAGQFGRAAAPGEDLPPPTPRPTLASTPTKMRNDSKGKEFGLWPGVGVDVQLMTPRIPKIDILPFDIGIRGFVSGEVMAMFPPNRATANEGSLDGLFFPEELKDPVNYPSSAIGGGGSEVRSEQDTFEFAAAIGISIPINVLNRTVRIKPSFGWLNYRLKVSGRLLHAIKDDVNGELSGNSPTNIGTFGPNTRVIDLQKNLTKNINAIGTGVEVELESGKFGPIGAAVFASIHGYKVVGDRKFKFQSSQSFADGTAAGGDGLLPDTYRATWEHEIDPWIYRMKVGLRFHYVGE